MHHPDVFGITAADTHFVGGGVERGLREQDLRAGFARIREGQINLCCNGEGERGFFFFTPKLAMEEKVQ
jgi:hypothetical protein